MNLNIDLEGIERYRSKAQIARVISERWVNHSVYCPACGATTLRKYPNNQPVADFICNRCNEDYELKSSSRQFGKKIIDGAYTSMLERLNSNSVPSLFLLTYDFTKKLVSDLTVVPAHFFVTTLIEKRKALSNSAKRAGWVGCNILLELIPSAGKINLVVNGYPSPKRKVVSDWSKTIFLRDEIPISQRGWALDVWRCVEDLSKQEFTLSEMYRYESRLAKLHPNNKHVRPKIRQQLQVLRDVGAIEFAGNGKYRLISQ